MLRGVICTLACLSLSSCGDKAGPPTTHTNRAPAFVVDVPGGWKAQPLIDDPLGGKQLHFRGGRASHSLIITWRTRPLGDAKAKRTSFKQIIAATDKKRKIVGEGDLPNGGGAWLETDRLGGLVQAWLGSGGVTIECQAVGTTALRNACKSLRLPVVDR